MTCEARSLLPASSIDAYNIGIDHLLTNDLVVDFRISKAVTEVSEDLFAGFGGGIRF